MHATFEDETPPWQPLPRPGEPVDSLTRIVDRNIAMRAFLLRMLDPEDLGHAVNAEVRAGVRQLLGLPCS